MGKKEKSRPKTISRAFAPFLALAAFTLSCLLPFGQAQSQATVTAPQPTQDLSLFASFTLEAAEGAAQGTEAALSATPTASPTVEATLTPAPTETAGPTPKPLPALVSEIKFRTGGTMAFVQESIPAGGRRGFIFGASGGQTLLVSVSSEDQQVYFELRGEDGSLLVPFSDKSTSTTLELPRTQDYQLTLSSPTDKVFFLTLEIPADLSAAAGSGPHYVNGNLEVYQQFHPDVPTRVRYLLELEEGTYLNVELSSGALEDLTLALTGADDGQPYLRYEVRSTALNDFLVPVSQAYYLDIYSLSGESDGFTLEIEARE